MTTPAPAPIPVGYGLRPSTARARAAEVRSTLHPAGKRLRRPLLLLVAGGSLGIGGWLAVSYLTAKSIWQVGEWPGPYGTVIAIGLVAYLAGVSLFSWGWELGVAGRAIRVAILLAIAGIVVWLAIAVVAFVLVALLKSDGDVGGGSGGGSTGGEGMLIGVGRTIGNAVEGFADGGGSLPVDDTPIAPTACATCGFIVDPNTMRLCPQCSTPVPGA
jgi:hypothetical protein